MAEGGGRGGGGCGSGGETRRATAYEAVGGRQRFTVKLRPGETTIVSWKKLFKDAASKDASPSPSSKPDKRTITGPGPAQSSRSTEQPLPPPAHPSLNARLAPGQVPENEAKDGPPTSRLSTVIERIERLYVGKASSDEEDLNDVVPDDDEYDTGDSFIDDTELDEYFQVDNSAIKHDGFFVNRGKLERVEPTSLPNQQPKKRRRNDMAKDEGGNVRLSNKHLKVGKKDGKSIQLNGKSSVNSQSVDVPSVHPENVKFQNQINASEISLKRKSAGTRITLEASHSGVCGGVPDQQKVVPSKDHGNKSKEDREFSDPSNEKLNGKSSSAQGKSSSGRSFNNVNELAESIQQREKGVHERRESSVPEGINSPQLARVLPIRRKEGSSGRPKSTMLDKAIRDLEKLVSDSRPPMEVQDSDNNISQAVKRRLRPEIKQKLAKVARLAQASHGKITKELLNRLMSIVGHMIQIRSLKRNLETMVSMGLSAKQEKDIRVQQIKMEVAEMVRTRIPLMNSKALEQLAGASDDFQESNTGEKEACKRKYCMDDSLEDKICYLYDLYIEGLEEDAGPQVRKLYAELAALWPSGFMDNHGIKRAICRAKDRQKALQSLYKEQEKIKRKVLAPQTEENFIVEANPLVAQPHYADDELVSDGSDHGLTSCNKYISSSIAADASVKMPVSFMNGPNTAECRLKQEKLKGGSSSSSDTKGMTKQVKRKAEGTTQGEERKKLHKQVAVAVPKSILETPAPS